MTASRLHRLILPAVFLLGTAAARADLNFQSNDLSPSSPAPVWALSRDGETVAYLVAAPAVGGPGVIPVHRAMRQAYKQCEILLFVDDYGRKDDSITTLHPLCYLPEGERLFEKIPPALASRMEELCGKLGMEQKNLQGMQVWFAANNLYTAALRQAGFEVRYSLAGGFHVLARRDNKQCVAMETLEQGFTRVSSLPLPHQRNYLAFQIARSDSLKRDLTKALLAWRRGDMGPLRDLHAGLWESYPELAAAVIDPALQRFTDSIVKELEVARGPVMVLLDDLSLVAPNNLLERLEAKGYQNRQCEEPAADTLPGGSLPELSPSDLTSAPGVFARFLTLEETQ